MNSYNKMKIILTGQYKHTLFKEFIDENGKPKDVGQPLLEQLLKPFETGEPLVFGSDKETEFIQILRTMVKDHSLRYAKVDLLYWHEFQNLCSDSLTGFLDYLQAREGNKFLEVKESQTTFMTYLRNFETIIDGFFDILNCDKITNVSYFALCQEISLVFVKLFALKVIGIEGFLAKVIEFFDSLIILCATYRQQIRFHGPNSLDLGNTIVCQFNKQFAEIARKMSTVTSKKMEDNLMEQKVKNLKARGFIEIEGIKHNIHLAYKNAAQIIQLGMNVGLDDKNFKTLDFEKAMPPQFMMEVLTEILNNPYLPKETKSQSLEVMTRLIQLDVIPRFGYNSVRKNPYFAEAIKFNQLYIEIFKKLAEHHTVIKLKEGQQDVEMEGDEERCSPEQDFIKSQNFMSDFLGFLDDIAKVKQRSVNNSLFSQIMNQIVDCVCVKYIPYVDPKTGKAGKDEKYPLNLTCQIKSIKLLKNILKSQQSFDDTSKLTMVIDKLRHEIQIIQKQSQYRGDGPKAYQKTFDQSWSDDDDYVSKYQTISQRHQLVKLLLKFLCFCIVRSDPNMQSYDQNFIAHSRKILESSIIQDDLLLNIFKVHETLPNQTDENCVAQIEETVTPLVLGCIQLTTQVFNDLPSKISTFISNGVFQCVINSLTAGGIPVATDMLFIVASYMRMLTLNEQARNLLISSGFMKQLCSVCLLAQKYHKYLEGRRTDYNAEQMLQDTASSTPELADQMISTILMISKEIVTRSYSLLKAYISMDMQVRVIEEQIKNDSLEPERKEELINKKNELKEPYELQQQRFENFFNCYYIICSRFLEQERSEQHPQIVQALSRKREEILNVLHEIVCNPVVASALHQYSEYLITTIIYILNSKGIGVEDATARDSKALREFVSCRIIPNLKSQIENLKLLLNVKDLSDVNDITPTYSDCAVFYEKTISTPDAVKMQKFVNHDNNLRKEDQVVIVLRKISFYVEFINMSGRRDEQEYDTETMFGHCKFLFSTEGFLQTLTELGQLSMMITKNRGINYSKSIAQEQVKLKSLIEKYGEKITKCCDDQFFDKKVLARTVTNELNKGRLLFLKYGLQKGEISICKDYDIQQENADVMNFECDDSICTHGQACQTVVKKLFRSLQMNLAKHRGMTLQRFVENVEPGFWEGYDFAFKLGSQAVKDCLCFFKSGSEAVSRWQIESQDWVSEYDNILFDSISGLFQLDKVTCAFNQSGPFIQGLFQTLYDTNFVTKMINFGIDVTMFIEDYLQKGQTLPMFKLSYLKVMWRDIAVIVNTLINARFLPNELSINKFLFECSKDVRRFKKEDGSKVSGLSTQIINSEKTRLRNLIGEVMVQLGRALFDQPKVSIFAFSNKYCHDTFIKAILKVYDNLLKRNESLPAMKRLAVAGKAQPAKTQAQTTGMQPVMSMGENGRFQVMAGIAPDVQMSRELQEMGFEEEKVYNVLRETRNNFDDALQMLLLEKDKKPAEVKTTEPVGEFIHVIEAVAPKAFDEILIDLVFKGFNQQLGDSSAAMYQHFDYDKETKEIYGHRLRLDKVYSTVTTLLWIYSFNKDNVGISSLIESHFKTIYSPIFASNTSWSDLKSVSDIKSLVVMLYLFKKLTNLRVFDAKFYQENATYNQVDAMANLITILTKSLNRLAEVYATINQMEEKPAKETDKNSRDTNVLLNDQLILLGALIQISQEILAVQILSDKLCAQVTNLLSLAHSVRDFSHTEPSEQQVNDKANILKEFHKLLAETFYQEPEPCRIHFEKLMLVQIALLKVYGQTPLIRYNHEAETLYPVTLSLLILKMILVIHDSSQNKDKPNLRKKFIQNDGLKHLFGVRVIDNYCMNPDDFNSADISAFIKEQLQNDAEGQPMVDSLMNTLFNNRQSMITIYEQQIKKLMFVQYKMNTKQATKKDILEWYKPVLEGIDTQSPKASKKTKKPKGSKQLKILMKKNEAHNEVPLKQFMEFFLQHDFFLKNPVSSQVDYFEYFLTATRGCCVIDTVDNEVVEGTQTRTEKVTAIKLKNSVLKDLIMESKHENAEATQWQTDFKKQVVDMHYQAEVVQQLLDILVNQIKGYKMGILKGLKTNKLDSEDLKLELKGGQLVINQEGPLQMSKYLFDETAILEVLSNEFVHNEALMGAVLKHKDTKTFKYIIRNILPLQFLKLVGQNKQVVFRETADTLAHPIMQFFKRILLDFHTGSKKYKVYRQEARKIFVKEVSKNLIEQEMHGDSKFNTKLVQNYCALLLISQFLMESDQRNEKLLHDQRIRAIFQSIRRYNQEQKTGMINQILYECQMKQPAMNNKFQMAFFGYVLRIRDELRDQSTNPLIEYKPKALTKCIDTVIAVLNQFAKQKQVWDTLTRNPKKDGGKASAESKKSRRRKVVDEMMESDDESIAKHMAEDDPDLTFEDKQDIEEMLDEQRRTDEVIEDIIEEESADSELSDIDDSYGEEGNEDDLMGEFSDGYYNEDESMEGEYYDEESAGSQEENEQELIPLDEDEQSLLINSQEDDGEDEDSFEEISQDELSMQPDSFEDGRGSRTFSDDLSMDRDAYGDDGFGSEFGNSRSDANRWDDGFSDDFPSSMESAFAREREQQQRNFEHMDLDNLQGQLDGGELRDIEQLMNQQGFRRVERAPRSRSLSADSRQEPVFQNQRAVDQHREQLIPRAPLKRESEGEFWKNQRKDLEDQLKGGLDNMSIHQKFQLYNLLFTRIGEMMQLFRKLFKKDENLIISNTLMVKNNSAEHPKQALPNKNLEPSSLKETDEKEGWRHQKVDMSKLQGYDEFMRAIRVISGEEKPAKEEPVAPEEPNQIDSRQQAQTLDLIDPLFAQALNTTSIQTIKENDKLIQNIQNQSALVFKQQASTVNDFIKKQSVEQRQQILKDLPAHIISYLSSDLYLEATKLRAPANPAQRGQPSNRAANNRRNTNANNQMRAVQSNPNPALAIRGQSLAATDAILAPEGLPALTMQSRNRFMSMDSQNMKQRLPCDDDVMKKGQRDSESEDLNIPMQKSNFQQNAFFVNIHTFMKENLQNFKKTIIKDVISTPVQVQGRKKETIYTQEDLDQYLEGLVVDQFRGADDQDQEDANIEKLMGILELAMTEIMCSKASTQLKHITNEKQLAKFKIIAQIPNFRMGLIVKIIQVMNNEIKGLVSHVNTNDTADPSRKITVFKGSTAIWDMPTASEPKLYGPKQCLGFFLKIIQELQQMLFVTKSSKVATLDLLKTPASDPSLTQIYKLLGLDSSFASLETCEVMHMSLFDQILQMTTDYISMVYNFPEAFEFQESQQREFNRWKQEVLQNLCLLLSQIKVALNILIRKKPTAEQRQQLEVTYSFSQKTLSNLFKIMFFQDQGDLTQKNLVQQQNLFMDQQSNSIKMVSRLLFKLAMLPIKSQGANLLDFEEKAIHTENNVAHTCLSDLLDTHLNQFTVFFGNDFGSFDSLSKLQRQHLAIIIQKIQHILKIYLVLADQSLDQQPNICSQEFLSQVLGIVQKIITNDQQHDKQDNFLFREEFKLIMQLIFSLSEYDLKYELLEARQDEPKASKKKDKKKNKEPVVRLQSIEDIKSKFDPNSRESNLISSSLVEGPSEDEATLKQVLSRYKPGRVQELIEFFFRNKTLINKFICVNQTVVNDQFQDLVIQVPQILNFDSKRLIWKICIKKYIKKHFRDNDEFDVDLQVRRNQVFGDSFEQLKHLPLESWKKKFSIEFHDEEGVDEGGLTKEWFELLSKGIFDPNYALFLQSGKGSTYYPNPGSVVHEKEEMIAMFRFVGRFIGKAIIEGQLLDCYFVKALYKMMLDECIQLSDLEDYDEQVHKSLLYMLENDAEMLCQSFVFSSKLFDEEKDMELKPNGKEIDVTNENKFEYCQLVLNYRLYNSIKTQVDAFLQGFHDLVPSHLIKIFDCKELELLISGLPTIDIEDLKENTTYKNYNASSNVVVWLFEVLEEFNNSERAEFIQFVTGSSKVPVEGFKALRGTNGVQKFQIIKYQCEKPDKRLPAAHTCFFQLDLPEYSSKEVLRGRIFTVIKEAKNFGMA